MLTIEIANEREGAILIVALQFACDAYSTKAHAADVANQPAYAETMRKRRAECNALLRKIKTRIA